MKIIKSEAVKPQPLRQEGTRSECEEIFIFDTNNNFKGTEWRIKPDAEVPSV